jgi:hypothetical protein
MASTLQTVISSRLRRATKHSLATLDFVPEDKLDFKPSETAKSCRELAQHIVQGNCLCLQTAGQPTNANPEEQDLAKLKDMISATGEQLVAYAESLDENAMAGTVDFFGNPFPMPAFLLTAEWHMSRHAAQIDYVQTAWGDLDDHMH